MSESMIERVAKSLAWDHHRTEDNWEEWKDAARAAIEAMRTPTDEQRNAYYELSHKTETMMDAHWERAIDAALSTPDNDKT